MDRKHRERFARAEAKAMPRLMNAIDAQFRRIVRLSDDIPAGSPAVDALKGEIEDLCTAWPWLRDPKPHR